MSAKVYRLLVAGLAICICLPAFMLYAGAMHFNHPSHALYPVRGVDVSAYQGEIDWDVIKGQGIQFAFIKATEGSGSVDRFFHSNYEAAIEAGLRVGAYHFFSYDSSGSAQADSFIREVKKTDHMLPPVVDVEFYGDYHKNPPEKEYVWAQLRDYIDKIEAAYGVPPIIYATGRSYEIYIKDHFMNCDIWIRNVFFAPSKMDDRHWAFWQYADRGRLEGFAGEERFIDLNVFHGSEAEFERYGL